MRIEAKNLSFDYSEKSKALSLRALDNISLTIEEGEFFGIIGHTGSGKSTFVQHLNGLIKLPTAQKKYKAYSINCFVCSIFASPLSKASR